MFDLVSDMLRQYEVGRLATKIHGEIKLPRLLGLTEGAVRAVGINRAVVVAQRVAAQTGKNVVVPIPGSGKSRLIKSVAGEEIALQANAGTLKGLGADPYVDALINPAIRGPMPERLVRIGHRGPVEAERFRELTNEGANAAATAQGMIPTQPTLRNPALVGPAVAAGAKMNPPGYRAPWGFLGGRVREPLPSVVARQGRNLTNYGRLWGGSGYGY